MSSVAKPILITGCSSGIGKATAERLAGAGHTVYATARRIESIKDLAERGCRTLALDVTDEESMRAAVDEIERTEGAVGVLVNNAGYGLQGAVEEVPLDEVRRQFETNVFGLVRLTQLVLPGMRRQRCGRVINVSSMGGKITLPLGAFYHATKHSVEAISDALRFEVGGFGIDVVVIEPGAIKTGFDDVALDTLNEVTGDGGPYGVLKDGLRKRMQDVYEGPMAVFSAEPDAVARAIEKAVTAKRPRTRYVVTVAAKTFVTLKRVLPDRAFDGIIRSQLPRPS